MTGFFRGPSLTAHAFRLALLEAAVVVGVRVRTGSFAIAFGVGALLALVYAAFALMRASRRPSVDRG